MTLKNINAAMPVVKTPRKAFLDQKIEAIIQIGKRSKSADFLKPYFASMLGSLNKLIIPNMNNHISGNESSKCIESLSPSLIAG